MEETLNKWPIAIPNCRICAGTSPTHRYRTRGLCTRCYLVACKEKDLWRYPKIPNELKDQYYDWMLKNPRRYVGENYSAPYARGFEDSEILEEAKRLFNVTLKRWKGEEAHVVDPRPTLEEVVWGYSNSVTEPEEFDTPESQPLPSEKVREQKQRQSFMQAIGQSLVDAVVQMGSDLSMFGTHVLGVGDGCWTISWGDSDTGVILTVQDFDSDDVAVKTLVNGKAFEAEFTRISFASHVQRLKSAIKEADLGR